MHRHLAKKWETSWRWILIWDKKQRGILLIQITWQGHYLDGKTADKQAVEIHLQSEDLRITTKTGTVFLWPYQEIKQTQGFYRDEPVQLERGGKIPEILLIKEHEFLTSLHHFMPKSAKRFHDPAQRGLRLRLTIYAAAGIIAVGVFFYVWGIPLLAKAITPHVPLEWEKGMGDSILSIVAPEDKRCNDKELQRSINDIVARLSATDPGPYSFKVFVVKSPIFNAVALPGGNIVVFSGLLEKTPSPESLAAILAHEMQHIKKRHVTKRIIEDSSTGLIISAVSGDVTGSMLYGVKIAHNLAMLSYSREDEEEADAGGMKMLLAANIDPEAMIHFFETMKEKNQKLKMPQYLSTHPDLDERISRLKTIIAQAKIGPHTYIKLYSGNNWNQLKKMCTVTTKPKNDAGNAKSSEDK
jgi:beta-barrel assembly-enhancing protease